MSRIRTIKPEFWTNAQILECSTNARLLFVGLWNFCDDAGRHPYSPKQVKAEVFPADPFTEQEIMGFLTELSSVGLIVIYAAENKEYFYVTGWKHQRIDKPHSPRYPDPFGDNSLNDLRTLPPDRIGKDRIGKKTLSPKPTTSDHKQVCKKKLPEYSVKYEQFWQSYPDRRNNSKTNAWAEWQKLSEPDREAAAASVPAFAEYCRKTPDYRVLHCERYLRGRRFDSWAPGAGPQTTTQPDAYRRWIP